MHNAAVTCSQLIQGLWCCQQPPRINQVRDEKNIFSIMFDIWRILNISLVYPVTVAIDLQNIMQKPSFAHSKSRY